MSINLTVRKLLDFLIRKRHWFLFILLEIISILLIYRSNAYQRNIILSTANVVSGKVISVSGNVYAYLHLKEVNKELLERNGKLEMAVLRLQDQIEAMVADTVRFSGFVPVDSVDHFPYSFITAGVVNNSVAKIFNYITLDKGRKDGVAIDMGVVSERGVVGIVSTVSDHYSVVLPVLNPKFRLSGKVLGSSYFGSLSWNGRSTRYANLDELPRHIDFQEGDTIITSGYSAVFPEGLMVGTVSSFRKQNDDNFYSLEVRLATDFHTLKNVKIIRNYDQAERRKLEEEARAHD